jgi:hypothetical protein
MTNKTFKQQDVKQQLKKKKKKTEMLSWFLDVIFFIFGIQL